MLGSWFRAGYEGFDDAQDYQRFLQQRDDDPNGSDGGGEDWSEDPIEQARLMRMGIDNRHSASSSGGGGGYRRRHMGLSGLEDLGAGDEDDEDANFSDDDDDDDDDADCGYYDEDETNVDALGAQPSKSRHFFNRSDNFENERERRVEAETAGHNFYGAPEARLLMTPQQKAMAREARRSHRMRLRAMEEANNTNNNYTTTTNGNYSGGSGVSVCGNSGGSEYYSVAGGGGGRIEGVGGRPSSSGPSAIARQSLVGLKRSSRRDSLSVGDISSSQNMHTYNNDAANGTDTRHSSVAIRSVPKASRTSALSAFTVPTCIVSKIEQQQQQQQQQQVQNSLPASNTSSVSRPFSSFSSASFCPSVAPFLSTARMANTPLRPRPPPLPVPSLAGHVALTIPPLLHSRAGCPFVVTFGGVNLAKVLGPSVANSGVGDSAGFMPPLFNGVGGGQLGRGSLFLEGKTVKVQRYMVPKSPKGVSHGTTTTLPLPQGNRGHPPPALEELHTVSHTSSRTGLLPAGRFGHCLVALGDGSRSNLSMEANENSNNNNNKRSLLLIGGCCDTNLDHLRNSIYDAGAGFFFGRTDIAGSGRHQHHNPNHNRFTHETPTAENPSIQICRAIVPRAVVSDPWLITLSARAPPPPPPPPSQLRDVASHPQRLTDSRVGHEEVNKRDGLDNVRGHYEGASSAADAAAALTFPTEPPKASLCALLNYPSSSPCPSSSSPPRQSMTDAEAVAELCRRANKRSLMGSYLTVNEQPFADGERGILPDSRAVIAGEEESQQHDSQLSAGSSSSSSLSTSTSSSSSLHSTVSSSSSLQYFDKETGRLLQRSSPSSLVDADFSSRPSFVPPPPPPPPSDALDEESAVQLNVDYRMVHAVVGDAPTPRCFATCLEIPFGWWNGSATTKATVTPSSTPSSSSSSSSHILLLYGGTYDGKHPIGWRKTRGLSSSVGGNNRNNRGSTGDGGGTRGSIRHNSGGGGERGPHDNVFDHILPDDIVLMTEQDTDASDGGEFTPSSSSRRTTAVAHHSRENDEDDRHTVEDRDGLASGPSADSTTTTTTTATTRSRAARIQRDRALAQDEIVLLHVDISERALICEAHTTETVSSIFAKKSGTHVSAGAGAGEIGGEKKTAGTPQSVTVAVSDRTPAPRFGHSAVLLESTRKMCVFGGVGGLASDLIVSNRRSGKHGSRYTADSSGAVVVVGPRGRSGHNAAIMAKKQPSFLGDCWLLDLMSMRWQEIILWHASPNPLSIPLRAFHSAVVLSDVSPSLSTPDSGTNNNNQTSSGTTRPSLSSSSSSPTPSPVSFTREHVLLIGGHLRDASGHANQRHSPHYSAPSQHTHVDKRGDVSALGVVCIAVSPSSWRPLATRLPEPLCKGQQDLDVEEIKDDTTATDHHESRAADTIYADEVMSLASEARLHAVACEKCNRRRNKTHNTKKIKQKRVHSGNSTSVYDQNSRYGQNNAEEEDAKRADREARLSAIKAANTAISVGDKVSLLSSRRSLQPILNDCNIAENGNGSNKNIHLFSSNTREDAGFHAARQQHTSRRAAFEPHAHHQNKNISSSSISSIVSTSATNTVTLSVELLRRLDHDQSSARTSSNKNRSFGMNTGERKAEGEGARIRNADNGKDNDGEPSAREIEASRRKVAEMFDDDEAFVAEHDNDDYQTKSHSGSETTTAPRATNQKNLPQDSRIRPSAFSAQGGSGGNSAPEKKKKRIQFDVEEPEACGRGVEKKSLSHATYRPLGAENTHHNINKGGANNDGFIRPPPIDEINNVDGDEDESDFDFDIPDVDELLLVKGRTPVASDSPPQQRRNEKEEDTANTLTWDSVDAVLADREKEGHLTRAEKEVISSSSTVGPQRGNTVLQTTLKYRFVDSFHGGYLQAVVVPLRADGTPSYSHRISGTCCDADSGTIMSSSPSAPLSFNHAGSSSTAVVLLGGDASYDLPLATVLMMPSLYSNGGAHHDSGASLRHIREEENYLESLHRRMSRHSNNSSNGGANKSVTSVSTSSSGGGPLDLQSIPTPIHAPVVALKQPSSLHMFGPKSSALLFPSLRFMVAEMLAEDDRWLLGITADLAKTVQEKCAREGWTLPLRSAASGNTCRSAYLSLLPNKHHLLPTSNSNSNNAVGSVCQHVYEPTDVDAGRGDPSRVARYAAASRGLAYRPKKKAANALYF